MGAFFIFILWLYKSIGGVMSTSAQWLYQQFPNEWLALLNEEMQQHLYACCQQVMQEVDEGVPVYPQPEHIFNALRWMTPEQVKVVILGQDPYHGPGQAHGYAFSVPHGMKVPPSLRNMYQALQRDFPGYVAPDHGNLERWAEQGVLLLNTIWSVRASEAGSHGYVGWHVITAALLQHLTTSLTPRVFILWGKHAQKACSTLPQGHSHLLLRGVHPSPLSAYRGFFEQEHFKQANLFLEQQQRGAIDWRL